MSPDSFTTFLVQVHHKLIYAEVCGNPLTSGALDLRVAEYFGHTHCDVPKFQVGRLAICAECDVDVVDSHVAPESRGQAISSLEIAKNPHANRGAGVLVPDGQGMGGVGKS